ncbi:hypothetical protein EJ03DRAFT_331470 [Teratosphaeria nubilosa]|uniref:Uncharacterized protein n=1 Tax=Teratosphaeria nubilosa TaxID=161662 RepID=A0A6G1KWB4_9PEZI|nr:hypothetical protein EJ03DRAFT_331470 [Teratosphaeria nubilosa]
MIGITSTLLVAIVAAFLLILLRRCLKPNSGPRPRLEHPYYPDLPPAYEELYGLKAGEPDLEQQGRARWRQSESC